MATTNQTPPTGSLPPSIHISFLHVAIFVAALVLIVGCTRFFFMHSVHVDLGEEVVFVDNPYFWGKSGVRDTPLKVGRKTEFNTTTEIRIKVTPSAYTIPLKDLPTKGPYLVSINTVVQLKVTNSAELIKKFGIGWFDDAFSPQYPSLVRSVIGKRAAADLIGDADVMKQVELELEDDIRTMLTDEGIAVELIDVAINQVEQKAIPLRSIR